MTQPSDPAIPQPEAPAALRPRPLIDAARIDARVAELARQIDADYAGADEVLLIGVLRGAFIFLADLARRLQTPNRVDFIALSSYGAGTVSSGEVRLIMDLKSAVAGRHLLIVEDIVDSGHTLDYLLRLLAAREPASLRSCALLRKLARREVEVEPDYLGFDIPDLWVVGYGLDHADHYRTLPYIGVIDALG